MIEKIIRLDEMEKLADKYISYANDSKMFAIVGKDLYVKRLFYYDLLKENYRGGMNGKY